jgi:hypothetical protein
MWVMACCDFQEKHRDFLGAALGEEGGSLWGTKKK